MICRFESKVGGGIRYDRFNEELVTHERFPWGLTDFRVKVPWNSFKVYSVEGNGGYWTIWIDGTNTMVAQLSKNGDMIYLDL